jgi:hypothetical protein
MDEEEEQMRSRFPGELAILGLAVAYSQPRLLRIQVWRGKTRRANSSLLVTP